MSGVRVSDEGTRIWERVQEWGSAPDPRALPALVALLRIEDAEGAADALGYVQGTEAVNRLHDLALDGSPRVVLWARSL